RTSGAPSSSAVRSVAIWASPGRAPSTYTTILRTPASGDEYRGCSTGTTAGSPDAPSAQIVLMWASFISSVQPLIFDQTSGVHGFSGSLIDLRRTSTAS